MTAITAVRIPPLACHGLGLQLAGTTVLSAIDLSVVAGETPVSYTHLTLPTIYTV